MNNNSRPFSDNINKQINQSINQSKKIENYVKMTTLLVQVTVQGSNLHKIIDYV